MKMARAKPKDKRNEVVDSLEEKTQGYKSVVKEIVQQYREITVGAVDESGKAKDKKVRIRYPTLAAEEDANYVYSKVYGELMENKKFKFEEEILEEMKERGVWGDEKDRRLELVQEKVNWLIDQLLNHREKMTKDQMERLSKQYTEMKKEGDELLMKKYAFTQNSIQGRAGEAKLKALVVRSTFYVNGDEVEHPIWENDEDLANEKDRVLSNRVVSEYMTFASGVPSHFLENLPEVKSGKTDTPSRKKLAKKSSQSPSPSGDEEESSS
jgi:hypothetical protein